MRLKGIKSKMYLQNFKQTQVNTGVSVWIGHLRCLHLQGKEGKVLRSPYFLSSKINSEQPKGNKSLFKFMLASQNDVCFCICVNK